MSDEPMPTRWSFQDFKLFYDAKFGRKRISENGDTADKPVSNGNGNLHANNTSDRAIYEQFQNQGQNSNHLNGFPPINIDERPYGSLT